MCAATTVNARRTAENCWATLPQSSRARSCPECHAAALGAARARLASKSLRTSGDCSAACDAAAAMELQDSASLGLGRLLDVPLTSGTLNARRPPAAPPPSPAGSQLPSAQPLTVTSVGTATSNDATASVSNANVWKQPARGGGEPQAFSAANRASMKQRAPRTDQPDPVRASTRRSTARPTAASANRACPGRQAQASEPTDCAATANHCGRAPNSVEATPVRTTPLGRQSHGQQAQRQRARQRRRPVSTDAIAHSNPRPRSARGPGTARHCHPQDWQRPPETGAGRPGTAAIAPSTQPPKSLEPNPPPTARQATGSARARPRPAGNSTSAVGMAAARAMPDGRCFRSSARRECCQRTSEIPPAPAPPPAAAASTNLRRRGRRTERRFQPNRRQPADREHRQNQPGWRCFSAEDGGCS